MSRNTYAIRTYSAIYDNHDSIRGTHIRTVAEFPTAGEAWEYLTTEYPWDDQSYDFSAGCVVYRDGDRDNAPGFHFPTVDVLTKPVDPWAPSGDGFPF